MQINARAKIDFENRFQRRNVVTAKMNKKKNTRKEKYKNEKFILLENERNHIYVINEGGKKKNRSRADIFYFVKTRSKNCIYVYLFFQLSIKKFNK